MTIEKNSFKPLVIRELIARKNKKLAQRIPSFIYRYLNRIIHVDEVNRIMKTYGHLQGIEFIDKVIEDFNIKFKIEGLENIPQNQKLIFASNHPLGGFDGVMLMSIVSKHTGRDVRFLVNDFLMHIEPIKSLFIPINKVGGQARDSLRKIEEAYESDAHMLIFPAGLCSRKIKGEITDLKWNKHFVQKSWQHKRDIIPLHFSGRNSNFFYNLARFRKFIGLKRINIEMLYLADEMFKHKNKEFTIAFNKKVSFENFSDKSKQLEWTEKIREMCYSLKD